MNDLKLYGWSEMVLLPNSVVLIGGQVKVPLVRTLCFFPIV